jgi:protein-S-isoprenylcysteine O-methyltransferase Ste14
VPFLAVPYSVLGIAALACVEVVLASLWVLSMVRRGAIFDERAFRWVGVISVAGLVAAVIVAALCAHLGEIDDAPGLVLIGGGVAIGGAAFALLMVVMRGLLRSATMLRRELDDVV